MYVSYLILLLYKFDLFCFLKEEFNENKCYIYFYVKNWPRCEPLPTHRDNDLDKLEFTLTENVVIPVRPFLSFFFKEYNKSFSIHFNGKIRPRIVALFMSWKSWFEKLVPTLPEDSFTLVTAFWSIGFWKEDFKDFFPKIQVLIFNPLSQCCPKVLTDIDFPDDSCTDVSAFLAKYINFFLIKKSTNFQKFWITMYLILSKSLALYFQKVWIPFTQYCTVPIFMTFYFIYLFMKASLSFCIAWLWIYSNTEALRKRFIKIVIKSILSTFIILRIYA